MVEILDKQPIDLFGITDGFRYTYTKKDVSIDVLVYRDSMGEEELPPRLKITIVRSPFEITQIDNRQNTLFVSVIDNVEDFESKEGKDIVTKEVLRLEKQLFSYWEVD